MAAASTPVNLSEFVAVARARMEPSAFDCYAGGLGDERALAKNRLAFDRLALGPRVLVDDSAVSLWTTVLDETLSFPEISRQPRSIVLGHSDGEPAAARAARERFSKTPRAELELAVALARCPSVASVDRSLIAFRPMR